MSKRMKQFIMSLSMALFVALLTSNVKVSAATIADQSEGEVVYNEYDSFTIKPDGITVLKVVLPKEGSFKMDLERSHVTYLAGYLYDEMGNELSHRNGNSTSSALTPGDFGYYEKLPAGTYYLKFWSNANMYGKEAEYTYYGSFIPTDKPSIEICIEVEKGKTVQLQTAISNSTDKKVTWKSSNKNVASVSTSGKVKGLKKGTTVIKTYTASGLLNKITVKVK